MVTLSRRTLASVAFLVAFVCSFPISSAQGQQQDYETTKGKSKPRYDEFIQEEYRVKTKYGRIYGVVVRPVVPKGVKVPVILTYSPYNILTRPHNEQPLSDEVTDYYTPRGYARALFDLVGTRESGGCYDYGGIRERKTGKAVVDFLGSQEWSNGKVGMIGGSYDGTTQWAAAVETPKHLTTIIPQVAIGRWWDYAYGQGVRFYSGSGTPYLFDFGFGFAPPTDPTDPEAWAEALRDHVTPCERVEHNDRAFLPDPVYDGFWEERDYLRRIDNVKTSVYIEGSWRDYNVHPINSIEMWGALPENHPKKLIMGQWGHAQANLPDSQNIRHAWFDYWLMGLDTGVMDLPQVDSQPNDRAMRFQDPSWPPPGMNEVSIGLAPDEAPDTLALEGDGDQAAWVDSDPLLDENTVLEGGAGSAAVLFVGPKQAGDLRIAGTPKLKASVTSSRISTFLTPVLFDEAPDGQREVITRGLLNSRNRDSLRESTEVTPGEVWRGRVYFQPVDWVLKKGHRLGLAVMSMNSSEALYADEERSTNDLKLEGASSLLLPIVGRSL